MTLSGKLWPAHIKPKRDELLSSWLVRLSMAHGQKIHSFCSTIWPGKAIWNRDIDKSADDEIIVMLSQRTATAIQQVRATTLAAYEGFVYEKHNRFGPATWITPVGVYHRTRRHYGLQYCPSCLVEDKDPYYRRKWRLAFSILCERHHALLRDRCPRCRAAVNFHRDELGDHRKLAASSLTLCYVCRLDLREASSLPSEEIVTHDEVEFIKNLLAATEGVLVPAYEAITSYPHLYFAGLRQVMKILAMRDKRINRLREAVSKAYGIMNYQPPLCEHQPDLPELSVGSRRQLLNLARCLLEEWPYRFVELSKEAKVWSSLWLRHLEPCPRDLTRVAPFWYWSVIHEHLYRAKYCPSNEEANAAIQFLKRHKRATSKSELARLLGVAVVRRNHKP